MIIRKLMTVLLATAFTAAPAYAQEHHAPLARQSAPAADEAHLGGGSSLFFLLAIVAVALGIVLLIDDDDAASA